MELEDRYFVIKRTVFEQLVRTYPTPSASAIKDFLGKAARTRALVVEADWPEYPIVAEMLTKRIQNEALNEEIYRALNKAGWYYQGNSESKPQLTSWMKDRLKELINE